MNILNLIWPKPLRFKKSRPLDSEILFFELFERFCQHNENKDAEEIGNDSKLCITESHSIEICTQLFRMEANISQLKDKEENRQTRSLIRIHKRMKKTINDFGVDFRDISGETYHPGRKDIDVLASDESSEVDRAVIARCESPVVTINGEIIQKAKATVLMPKNK